MESAGETEIKASNPIRSKLEAVLEGFDQKSTADDKNAIAENIKNLLAEHFTTQFGGEVNADKLHEVTTADFGFNPSEQTSYKSIDNLAWEDSQTYTSLKGVKLPDNARFFTKEREEISIEDVQKSLAQNTEANQDPSQKGSRLFDIALSNEYVLLQNGEGLDVSDIESRFSTNNEHLAPQSKARRGAGNVKVFKSDPRVIVISDMDENGARGNLQIVFRDEDKNAVQSISMLTGEAAEAALPDEKAKAALGTPFGNKVDEIFGEEEGKPSSTLIVKDEMHKKPPANFTANMQPLDPEKYGGSLRHQELAQEQMMSQIANPVQAQQRYEVGRDDAAYYAYALALTHFADGFSPENDRNWFDKHQAEEVARMLDQLSQGENTEPVQSHLLSGGKILKGNVNPVGFVPEQYAEALHEEINAGKFKGSRVRAMEAEGTVGDSGFMGLVGRSGISPDKVGHREGSAHGI
ncbi:MAG: hypothetical protein MK052_10500 [Alphaproteobacteria bacterium]|nr:hypothetical protein [Alphaproteobacteria bacterium]